MLRKPKIPHHLAHLESYYNLINFIKRLPSGESNAAGSLTINKSPAPSPTRYKSFSAKLKEVHKWLEVDLKLHVHYVTSQSRLKTRTQMPRKLEVVASSTRSPCDAHVSLKEHYLLSMSGNTELLVVTTVTVL